MNRRRLTSAAAALAVAVALASCTTGEEPRQPERRPDSPGGTAQPPADRGLSLENVAFWVGPPELVMGPTTYVDSLFNGIKVGDTVRGYVGNTHTVRLEGTSVADVKPTDERAIEAGTDPTVWDDCGAWLEGVERDEKNPRLLRAWYHAEWQCNYGNNQTNKSVAYAESRDGGRTFTKPGYPNNQVVASPTGAVEGHHTGRGAPTIIRRGAFYYMYYLNVLPDLKTVTSVARAPVSSGGVPGSWHNYTVDDYGRGRWTADARGGPASALDTKPPASSASVHLPSGEVVLARQNTPSGGIVLQASDDGIHFRKLAEPIVPYLSSQIRADWSEVDEHQIFGYTSIVGEDGSRGWSDRFYLFHLYVFPGDDLHGERYLVRRQVSVTDAQDTEPRSMVALTSYAGDRDRFETSAPVKRTNEARGEIGYLLGTPEADRRALLECTTPDGDRFLAAACGESAQEGRLAGYAFSSEQERTVALYRCASRRGDWFTSLDAECENGRQLSELGYLYPAS